MCWFTLVQQAASLWKLQPEVSAVWVCFSASAFGLDKDLHGVCVNSAWGSQQLHESPAAARFQLLSDAASGALQHGHVVLGGDFNAKVASANDFSGSDAAFLEDLGIA